MGYLLSILALAALCAAWAGVQLWLNKADPEHAGDSQGRCTSCSQSCDIAQPCSNRLPHAPLDGTGDCSTVHIRGNSENDERLG